MARKKSELIANISPLGRPVSCTVIVLGSKSYTNRALLIAALAKGKSVLYNCSDSDDSKLLIRILRKLGITIIANEFGIEVYGNGGEFKTLNGDIYVKDAGTVMRFMIALSCLIPGEIVLKGTKRMHQRPVRELVQALKQSGADITYLKEEGFAPLKIKGGTMKGGKVEVDASSSSQFISALLLISPLLEKGLEIKVKGEIVSRPYIDMTIDVIKDFGITTENKKYQNYKIAKGAYTALNYEVESDASGATYFFGIAAVTQSTIRVANLSPISCQGDVRFADLLMKMGCKVIMDANKNYIEVTGIKELKPLEADLKDMPDAAPALAVVAAFAKGTSIIKGLKNLELKESKRLTALQTELTRMGIECHQDGEQITIHGGNPKGAEIKTYYDHRIAMAFAIAATAIKDVSIIDARAVDKSFPGFWKKLMSIGVHIDFMITAYPVLPNIIFIGFMGSGKSTVSKLFAKSLNRSFYELDKAIIMRSGLKSINEIFDKKGEPFFRELEKQVVAKYAAGCTNIISCGGGIVTNYENIRLLKENGKLIYLSASFETICQRLKDDKTRPLFKNMKKARALYLERLPLYKKYADMIIYTDKLTPEEAVSNIISIAKTHDENNRAEE